MKKCPKCGATRFMVKSHVVQEWLVDEHVEFLEVVDDCVCVSHYPNKDDIWECKECGHSAPGEDFEVVREKEYVAPQLNVEELQKTDVLTSSVESLKSHIAEPGDWDNPIIDDDEDVIWD